MSPDPRISSPGGATGDHTHDAADITGGTISPSRMGSGTPDATTVLTGDGQWSPLGRVHVGTTPPTDTTMAWIDTSS